jgi:hypothetical protein
VSPQETYPVSVPAWWLRADAVFWTHPMWNHWQAFIDGRVHFWVEQP